MLRMSEPAQGRGRPSGYDPAYVEQARIECERGATDQELADSFGVDVRTIYRWKLDYPDFCQAIKVGKEHPDTRVERSLYERANGFEWVEQEAIKVKTGKDTEEVQIVEVTRRVPPDSTAMIFWLKNRKPAEWRDRVERQLSGPDGGPIPLQMVELRPVDSQNVPMAPETAPVLVGDANNQMRQLAGAMRVIAETTPSDSKPEGGG